jgi:hypothetical protein
VTKFLQSLLQFFCVKSKTTKIGEAEEKFTFTLLFSSKLCDLKSYIMGFPSLTLTWLFTWTKTLDNCRNDAAIEIIKTKNWIQLRIIHANRISHHCFFKRTVAEKLDLLCLEFKIVWFEIVYNGFSIIIPYMVIYLDKNIGQMPKWCCHCYLSPEITIYTFINELLADQNLISSFKSWHSIDFKLANLFNK